jgi:hypothetical protein
MRMPRGYNQEGKVLRLKKALYSLRELPLLWQKDFTNTLKEMGCKLVPYELYCWIKDGVIIFFYIDDIMVAYKKEEKDKVTALMKSLKERYRL